MRLFDLVVATCLAGMAHADRLISIPTGRKLPVGTLRLETLAELSRGRTQESYLGYGLSPYFEIEIRSERIDGMPTAGTFDLAYNYISPIPNLTPGVSFGVQDAMDKTVDGRRFYAAFTYRPMFSTLNGDIPADFTFGVFTGSHTVPFVGGTVPFSRQFRFLYEYNGIRPTIGFEVRPAPEVGLRLIYRERDVLGDVSFTKRF